MNALLDAALGYAARGWPVFPCHTPKGGGCDCHRADCGSPGKHPRTKNGAHDATTDAVQIERWWAMWPQASIGIATGAASGLYVLDVDPQHGGGDSLADLEREHGPLPDSPEVLTGGGGRHVVFAHPGGHLPSAVGIAPGLDIRADGGYIIAAPSLHESGRRYGWDAALNPTTTALAAPPTWLLALAGASRNNGHRAAAPLPDRIAKGERNVTLASLAGTMRRRDASESAIAAALLEENAARCDPSLPESEVRGIVASVMRYPASTDAAPWPSRESLPDPPAAPSLPPTMVPPPLFPWVEEVAARACIPLEFVVVPALVGAAAVVGRSVGIIAARYDDHVVAPNLWGGIVGRPGLMKTFAVTEAQRPLGRLAATARERHETEIATAEARRDRIEAEIAALKDAMKAAARPKKSADKELADLGALEVSLAAKRQELAKSAAPERRYMTQDATTEKLGELLRDNPRGLLVCRDELAGWLRTLERPGREGDREFYLESWNGTGGYTFDRIGRGTVHLEAITLSIIGGIQPGKLRAYIQDALTEGSGDDGLLQRFQMLVWPDALPAWKAPSGWPDKRARDRAYEVYKRLDGLPGSLPVETTQGDIPILRFAPDAQRLYDAWRDELEERLRSDALAATPAFEAHLAKYRSLMPSLALLFHLIDWAAAGEGGPVSLAAAKLAAAWCEYLEAHASKVYSAELTPGVDAAHALASKIKAHDIADGVTVRDIYRRHWKGLSAPNTVKAALDVLEAAGWVRVEDAATEGRPSEIVRLHPELGGGQDA